MVTTSTREEPKRLRKNSPCKEQIFVARNFSSTTHAHNFSPKPRIFKREGNRKFLRCVPCLISSLLRVSWPQVSSQFAMRAAQTTVSARYTKVVRTAHTAGARQRYVGRILNHNPLRHRPLPVGINHAPTTASAQHCSHTVRTAGARQRSVESIRSRSRLRRPQAHRHLQAPPPRALSSCTTTSTIAAWSKMKGSLCQGCSSCGAALGTVWVISSAATRR